MLIIKCLRNLIILYLYILCISYYFFNCSTAEHYTFLLFITVKVIFRDT